MQLKKAVGAVVLGVVISAGSVRAATITPEGVHGEMQDCLRKVGVYHGPRTARLDDATLQAWLSYMVARRGEVAVGQAAGQGVKAFEAFGQSVGEQLGRECQR